MAETRNWCGDFCEEIGRGLLHASRLQTDSTADVCPDLETPSGHYVEVKSIGQGRQGLVYAQRLEHDLELTRRTRRRLTYLFVIHNVRATDIRSLFALRTALAGNLECMLAIPLPALAEACAGLTPRVMNYRLETATKAAEPMPGYRLSWNLLRRLAAGQTRYTEPVTAYGIEVASTVLHASPDAMKGLT